MALTDSIAQAIAQMESGGNPNSLSYRLNNPGALRSWGSTPVVNDYASFPTMQAGWDALYQQVNLNIGRGLSLNEFFGGKPGVYDGYAPAADSNRPEQYAQFVADRIGVPVNQPLSGVAAGGGLDLSGVFGDTAFPGASDGSGVLSDTMPSGGVLVALAVGLVAVLALRG